MTRNIFEWIQKVVRTRDIIARIAVVLTIRRAAEEKIHTKEWIDALCQENELADKLNFNDGIK